MKVNTSVVNCKTLQTKSFVSIKLFISKEGSGFSKEESLVFPFKEFVQALINFSCLKFPI